MSKSLHRSKPSLKLPPLLMGDDLCDVNFDILFELFKALKGDINSEALQNNDFYKKTIGAEYIMFSVLVPTRIDFISCILEVAVNSNVLKYVYVSNLKLSEDGLKALNNICSLPSVDHVVANYCKLGKWMVKIAQTIRCSKHSKFSIELMDEYEHTALYVKDMFKAFKCALFPITVKLRENASYSSIKAQLDEDNKHCVGNFERVMQLMASYDCSEGFLSQLLYPHDTNLFSKIIGNLDYYPIKLEFE